jgi:predicted  nucleic acid-binding Zn-ribbon protein
MSFFCRLSRKHYWCVPHRSADKRLVQVCYECGAERLAHEFHDDFAAERLNQALASARTEALKLSSSRPSEHPSISPAKRERIAVGEERSRKFLLVK